MSLKLYGVNDCASPNQKSLRLHSKLAKDVVYKTPNIYMHHHYLFSFSQIRHIYLRMQGTVFKILSLGVEVALCGMTGSMYCSGL